MRGELKASRYRQEDKYLLHRNILDFLGSRILISLHECVMITDGNMEKIKK